MTKIYNMVIGIDASRANLTQKTGTEWYSYFLIEALKKIDHKNLYILYSKEPLQGELAQLPPNFKNKVLRWPVKFLWTQKRLSWEMLVHPPDVLFVPAHALPFFNLTKMVVTIHDVGFDVYPELYSRADKIYHRFCVWYASHFAGQIICPSEFSKKELVKYYKTNPNKVTVIPHGVITSENVSNPMLSNQKKFLLFIGRLEMKKNLIALINAFNLIKSKFPDLRLVLIGRPGHGYGKIKSTITDLGIGDRVKILGYIGQQQKNDLLRQAEAFVFPTLYEGFGMPVLEAQSLGCPVVTSANGACAEIAANSAILVDPHSVQEIATGINVVLSDHNLRQDLIQKGVENAKKFTWSQAAEMTKAVLMS